MKSLLSVFALASVSASAASLHESRFRPSIEALRPALGSPGSVDEAAKQLADLPGARIAAFNLQALGRLYTERDKEIFKPMTSAAKGLEDVLGGVDKWSTILKRARERGAPAGEVRRLEGKVQDAQKDVAKRLRKDGWAGGAEPLLRRFERQLAKFDGMSPAEDYAYMVERLRHSLGKVVDEEFDVSKLEEGNGLHEFRRRLRWFLIEARTLEGLLSFRPGTSCPVPALRGLLRDPVATSKYGDLPKPRPGARTCAISRCLFLELVDRVEKVGALKDEVEADVNIGGESDAVPAKYLAQARRLYADFVKRGGGPALAQELSACVE